MEKPDVLRRGIFLDMNSVNHNDLDFSQIQRQLADFDTASISSLEEFDGDLGRYDVVISNKVKLDRQTLQTNRNIRLICVSATGTNNVDLQAAHELGVTVCNVTAYATNSVVQHVFSLILALQTRLFEITSAVARGEWSRSPHFSLLDYPVQELAGKKLGIVGYGELGRAVAQVARAFGMEVIIAKRNPQDSRQGRVVLNDMLPQIDVLTLHCPLTDETHHLIDKDELSLMKSTAMLINTARGGIVNESALLDALNSQKIAAAALDVLSDEPPCENHPLLAEQKNNLIITPHVAWASQESRQRLINQVAENIKAFNRGEIRNQV